MDAKKSTNLLVAAGLAVIAFLGPLAADAGAAQVQWENYVSKHYTFTIMKPAGWVVQEGYQDSPRMWAFSVTDPKGLYQAVTVHGISPTGRDADGLVRMVVADLFKQAPGLQLAPTARRRQVPLADANGRPAGQKTIVLFEGVYANQQGQRRQFRTLVAGGDGLMLNQRIEAPEGQLTVAAPLLLQTLANLRVAKGVYTFDEGGSFAEGAPAEQQTQLVPRRLANGWGAYTAPANWQQVDLGNAQVIACDPTQQVFLIVAKADFVSPRYYNARVPNVLCANFMSPSRALAFACEKQGHGSNFRYIAVHERDDMVRQMRAGLTGGRPCGVEDFLYTFTHKGKAYKGFSLGICTGDYMNAGFSLSHFTIWAPADQFDAWVPTLARMLASYEINQKKAAECVVAGLQRYYAGIAQLSATIARNSEQMRRENLELFMQRGRVQDYTSYLTTRMIMGEYDYLSSSFGYVRGDPSGLYTPDGHRITNEPYGESITRHMQEINTRDLYETTRPRPR
ncbi:MAG: hypothetical protein FJ290_17150 [Planctomycetes bacterium]|nr:hypothetical protein [Planctomycetota bacterium]